MKILIPVILILAASVAVGAQVKQPSFNNANQQYKPVVEKKSDRIPDYTSLGVATGATIFDYAMSRRSIGTMHGTTNANAYFVREGNPLFQAGDKFHFSDGKYLGINLGIIALSEWGKRKTRHGRAFEIVELALGGQNMIAGIQQMNAYNKNLIPGFKYNGQQQYVPFLPAH